MKNFTQILISGVILPINLVIPTNTITITPDTPEMSQNQGVEQTSQLTSINTQDKEEPSVNEQENKEIIIEKAIEYNIEIDLALDIAKYESRYCTDPYNPKSSATGCYQFLTEDWVSESGKLNLSTWTAFCKNKYGFDDPENNEENITCFMKMMSDNPRNITHWTADVNTRKKLKEWVICESFEDPESNNCKLIHFLSTGEK